MSELMWIVMTSATAWACWRGRRPGLALMFGGLAALLGLAVARRISGWLAGTGLGPVVVVAALAGMAAIGWYRWSGSRAVVNRWGKRMRRKSGVASNLDIARFGSALAMRRHTSVVRPSLGELTRRERARLATTEVAIPLCRAGVLRVWASIEDFTLVFGIPRYGKSGWLGCQILDAPGAVITTSTKDDIYRDTAPLRARRGPVYVCNPTGKGPASTLRFDPVSGCDDPITAVERAEDMLPCGHGDDDREYWVGQARQALAALMHAAALGHRSMQAIAEWVADPEASKGEVAQLLRRSRDESRAFEAAAEQFLTTNDRTRSSIATSMRPALRWLTNPHARAVTTTGAQFDVAQLLAERGTLYLIGAKDGQSSTLLAALTGYIAREARRIAATQPKGRLDPQLSMFLDEVKLSCPVPLDQWTADMGGLGVHLIACFQSRAQLVGLWGQSGAAEIANNAGAIMVFGGSKDETDLRYWSTLFGNRDEEVVTTGPDGQITGRSVRQVQVFSPAQLAALPKFRVVAIRRYMLPVTGRATMSWERPDVRAHQKATQPADQRRTRLAALPRTARLVPAALTRMRTARMIGAARRRAQTRGAL